MSFLSDAALHHLREVADEPDLAGTRYQLLSRLGRGGMGTVYLAEDDELRRRVAIKVLSAPDPDGSLVARLINEARILARLEHPGIVPVHDVGRLPDGRVFYVMKRVRGRRLDEIVPTQASLPDALRIFLRLCETVAFAHARGVIHRDLKPQNIMVGEFGEVLVMDWGVAKQVTAARAADATPASEAGRASHAGFVAELDGEAGTAHGTRIGTPGYMAPEQRSGDVARIDHRADVYGLGAILDFMLANGGWARVQPRLARPLRAICERALAAEPHDRYGAVHELAADVTLFLDGEAVSAHREGPVERAARFVVRYRTAILLVLTYMILRVLFIVFGDRFS